MFCRMPIQNILPGKKGQAALPPQQSVPPHLTCASGVGWKLARNKRFNAKTAERDRQHDETFAKGRIIRLMIFGSMSFRFFTFEQKNERNYARKRIRKMFDRFRELPALKLV
jgi:hypothetical protein